MRLTRRAPTPSAGALQEVIVTAERREERLLEVPVSTAVLSGESLAVLGSSGQDIRQLAFAVPSLNIESSNGRTFPRFYIRGYGNTDFTTFASQPVGLYYDDIVQENPALKGFPIFDQQDVEVLRGPQGTLFGRNAPAGVVKIESAKPQLHQFSGYATLSYGTYDTSNIEAVLNIPAGEAWAFRASTQGQHRANWVDAPNNMPGNQHLEGYDDWAVRLQALFRPSDSFDALLNLHSTLAGWLGASLPRQRHERRQQRARARLRPEQDLHRRLQRPVLHQHRVEPAPELDLPDASPSSRSPATNPSGIT